MFIVSESEATAIRTAYDQGGELSAAIELRRLFPGITDNEQARACARTIAGWKPTEQEILDNAASRKRALPERQRR